MKFSVKIVKKKRPRISDKVYKLVHLYYYDRRLSNSYSIDFKILGKKRINFLSLIKGNRNIELNYNPYYVPGSFEIDLPKDLVLRKLRRYIRSGHIILEKLFVLIREQEKEEDRT